MGFNRVAPHSLRKLIEWKRLPSTIRSGISILSSLAEETNWMETGSRNSHGILQMSPHSLRKLIEWKLQSRYSFLYTQIYSSLAEETNWMETIRRIWLWTAIRGCSSLAEETNWMETELQSTKDSQLVNSSLAEETNWMETKDEALANSRKIAPHSLRKLIEWKLHGAVLDH